jgi:3-phosphoshikimate 1-carboxyvinyltransferase
MVGGSLRVPGDKSIAHRWLLLAAIAHGRSALTGLPAALDVASTALACASLLGDEALARWAGAPSDEADVTGAGRGALRRPARVIDCGNSGTTMRLLTGVLAASEVEAVLEGDDSLRGRPMERVAEPLRRMGAGVETTDGHAPVTVKGAALHGIRHETDVPSAQVKSAVLLAGIGADGRTEVVEPAPTRDHTERALRAMGATVVPVDAIGAGVERFEVPAFSAMVPGDVSSAAFAAGAAVVTGGSVEFDEVGLNPTRTRFLDVLQRMGATVERRIDAEQLGEPVGSLTVAAGGGLGGTIVTAKEFPEIVDEVPLLAAVAAHATGETRFEGAGELRVKESDRLGGLRDMLLDLGGEADLDGDALVVAGGGLRGGAATAHGDHRMAMAGVVAALAATGSSEIHGAEAAAVSFPGFAEAMRSLGAHLEER